MVLQGLAAGDNNARGLQKFAEDNGYEFKGKTEPYHRIHSELQRLKKAELVAPAAQRGFYTLIAQIEAEAEQAENNDQTVEPENVEIEGEINAVETGEVETGEVEDSEPEYSPEELAELAELEAEEREEAIN